MWASAFESQTLLRFYRMDNSMSIAINCLTKSHACSGFKIIRFLKLGCNRPFLTYNNGFGILWISKNIMLPSQHLVFERNCYFLEYVSWNFASISFCKNIITVSDIDWSPCTLVQTNFLNRFQENNRLPQYWFSTYIGLLINQRSLSLD